MTYKLFFIVLFWASSITFCNETQIEVQKIIKKSSILSELAPSDQVKLASLFANLGHEHRKKNKWILSVIYYRKSLALNPEDHQLILFSGMNYSKVKRYSKAIELFLQYKSVATQDSWLKICDQYLFDTLNLKGDQLSKTSLWDLAITSYNDALNYSNSAEKTANVLSKIHYGYFQKGSFHFSQKHYLEASKNLLKVLTPETNKSLVRKVERMASHLFLNSAKHYEKEGNHKEALKYYHSIANYFKSESGVKYSNARIKHLENLIIEDENQNNWISE
ncbi:MAG: hypothetical protein KC646_09895 [Candidatus Cloacimonetes bacterium]|nr:hypothetical protein [Candidatus Cloacimonadota bacterium]